MSDFKPVKKTNRRILLEKEAVSTSEESVDGLLKSLESKKELLKESKFYNEVLSTIKDLKVVKLRSLALGSPAQELQALYQLALIVLVVEDLDIKSVSLYDPVFAPLDKSLFEKLDYAFEEEYLNDDIENTLYFLPHAPLTLTNEFLISQKPKYLLANNLQSHTDRLTSEALFKEYPLLSKAVSLLDPKEKIQDGFETVVKKKRNRKNNQSNTQPKIDYNSIESYFTSIELKSFKDLELDGPWLNSFTDLSYHKLS